MRKFIVFVLVLFVFCTTASAEVDDFNQVFVDTNFDTEKVISGSVAHNIDMTLENCIKIALGNNPEITSAFEDILIADSKIRQIWSNYFPVISWQTSWSHIKQLQLSDALSRNLEYEYYLLGQISLQQMLYDFGITQNEATIARLAYQSDKKTFAGIVNDIIYQTKSAFYEVLYNYEAERIAQINLDNFQLFYNQAKVYYDVGLNPKIDVTIAQVNLGKAKMKLISAKNAVNVSLANLNNIMGIPYAEKYQLKGKLEYKPLGMSFEETIKEAMDSRPELKRAEIEVEKARQNVKLARKGYCPEIDAQFQYQRGGKHWTSNDGWNVGMYFNFSNLNIRLIQNQISEAKYLYNKQIAQSRKIQNNVYLEIQKSFLKVNEKSNQIPVARLQLIQAKENYTLSEKRYKVGVGSPIEMQEAQNNYAESQLSYYNALYQYNSAKAELERAIGKNISYKADEVILKK